MNNSHVFFVNFQHFQFFAAWKRIFTFAQQNHFEIIRISVSLRHCKAILLLNYSISITKSHLFVKKTVYFSVSHCYGTVFWLVFFWKQNSTWKKNHWFHDHSQCIRINWVIFFDSIGLIIWKIALRMALHRTNSSGNKKCER